ncbi:MAG: SDR family NAD(P)-dependent oxidoreductase [Defluviitaleaceae bacterium]|nr:SDR family NAD(P)-dependent oxidoreductase [Defluviitaleaceae bacterium]
MRIFITGSSRGLGAAMARHFAQNGHDVAINGSADWDGLNSAADSLREIAAGQILSIFADMSDYEVARAAFGQIADAFGGLDLLINNAGVAHIGLFSDMRPPLWQSLIAINQLAMLNCSHLAIPLMLKEQKGHIINISSIWGEAGASCEAVYSMTKGAVNSFTKALAKELAPANIRVNAIAPGVMDTEMNNFLTQNERKSLAESIPLGYFGHPNEIAKAAQFLIDCNYITGKILTIDGGLI